VEITKKEVRLMKCPRCGYTSFDYLDRCKSCGEDLMPAKIKLNIYTKQPELDTGDDGFMINRVSNKTKDMLGSSQQKTSIPPADDITKQSGSKGTSFDFGEDKIS
jgi:ribosomal protein L37E